MDGVDDVDILLAMEIEAKKSTTVAKAALWTD
jgi:hypothetical protein